MAKDKIKSEWAAIRITAEQAVIISTQIKDKPKSLFFSDLNAFRESLVNKEISVRKWAISVPDDACIKKRPFGGGGLPRIDMGHDPQIADQLCRDRLLRLLFHRPSP